MHRLRVLAGLPLILPPLLLLVLACSGCTIPKADLHAATHATALSGDWGGAHVSLSLTASGGQIEYDCAHGTLEAPLVPDASGAFSVPGLHVREHGGPVRMGEQPESQPALYQGTVSGDRLQLRVTSGGAEIGSYLLRRGAGAQLFRCL